MEWLPTPRRHLSGMPAVHAHPSPHAWHANGLPELQIRTLSKRQGTKHLQAAVSEPEQGATVP